MSFLWDGMFTSARFSNYIWIINLLITSASSLSISPPTTVEDALNLTKAEILTSFRVKHVNINGNKLTLAQRCTDSMRSRSKQTESADIMVNAVNLLCADSATYTSELLQARRKNDTISKKWPSMTLRNTSFIVATGT